MYFIFKFKLAFKKTYFLKFIKGTIEIFFFKNLRPHLQNSFVPKKIMFSVLGFKIEPKKAIEN